jgi:hypothetical protein
VETSITLHSIQLPSLIKVNYKYTMLNACTTNNYNNYNNSDIVDCVFRLFLKNESRLIKFPVCLTVCPPLILLNLLVEFHEICYGCNAVQGDLDAIISNPIASILKLLRFKVVRSALLNCGFWIMFHGNHGNQVVYYSKLS